MADRRVVHVIRSDGFAGVERYVCDTATELSRRGWDVTVVGGDPALMRTALPAEVGFLPAHTTAEVSRAILAAGPTPLLHTHMTAAEAAALPLKRIRFDRWITTRHFASERGSSGLGRAARPLIRARVDVQIAISQFVADSVDGPSVVIHNGVPASTQPHRDRERSVVMMQRLEAEKDTATGLRAWASSGLAADGWKLRVFGRGSERERLQRLAVELGANDSVTFEGFADDPRRALSEAGIVLATAPAEPFGLSVIEAMAEGAPVVAADGGAHRETLGDAASLFAPGDVSGAAAALIRLASSETARERVSDALRERHGVAFTIERHVDRLEALYVHP